MKNHVSGVMIYVWRSGKRRGLRNVYSCYYL